MSHDLVTVLLCQWLNDSLYKNERPLPSFHLAPLSQLCSFCFHHYHSVLLSSTRYITAAFTLSFQTSWAWNKLLHCCTLHSIVKYTKAQPLVEDACTWQRTLDTWTNVCDWTGKRTFTSLKVCDLKIRMQGTSFFPLLCTLLQTSPHLWSSF